uniref:Uncharacterized protein n=1 Tax=Trichobilharzia regenti TaxID=157069 RepID=A0AA85JSY6_TRIRE|nr:unnamed protein product [Trichobilharzia regenti]
MHIGLNHYALKPDSGHTAAELVDGATLQLPVVDHASYFTRLTGALRSVKPASLRPKSMGNFVHPCLKNSSHVFVRRDSVSRHLEPSYDGPYKVIECMDKFFVLHKCSGRLCMHRSSGIGLHRKQYNKPSTGNSQ